MRNRCLRVVVLAGLAMVGVFSAVSPAGSSPGPPPPATRDCEDRSGNGGFERAQYEVAEDAGIVWLPVCRGWGPTWQGEIDFRTFDGTAVAGQDYEQTSQTLGWLGESPRCCVWPHVTIFNDELFEGDEWFEVRLTEYRGTFAGRGRDSAIVNILDDDPRPSSGSSWRAQSSSQAGTGGGTRQAEGPREDARPTEVSRPDSAAASMELKAGPGFELIGSDLASGPADSARLPEDERGIAATVFLVLLAGLLVSGGGGWIWRRRSSW